jgi:hypothetical protein
MLVMEGWMGGRVEGKGREGREEGRKEGNEGRKEMNAANDVGFVPLNGILGRKWYTTYPARW